MPDNNRIDRVKRGVDALEEVLRVSTFPIGKVWFAPAIPCRRLPSLLVGRLESHGPF